MPAHFPKDDFALRRFDGTALYEHADPRSGEHPGLGHADLQLRPQRGPQLPVANALYWLQEFHVDGLRVDAVASMLYLDYSRKHGRVDPQRVRRPREPRGCRLLARALNRRGSRRVPRARFTAAEESTAWRGVTRPARARRPRLHLQVEHGMDARHACGTSRGIAIHRRYHQDELTFAMLYEYSERFIMPLSHDEVVHGKRSLVGEDARGSLAEVRQPALTLAYQWTRPGKKLLFMGTEIAPYREWNIYEQLDWSLTDTSERRGLARYFEDMGNVYRSRPCLWEMDHEPGGMEWLDTEDREQSILSYVRRSSRDYLVVLLNLTPVPRRRYRFGALERRPYVSVLNSDDVAYGGSGFCTATRFEAEPVPWHRRPQSFTIDLPPLAAVILAPE